LKQNDKKCIEKYLKGIENVSKYYSKHLHKVPKNVEDASKNGGKKVSKKRLKCVCGCSRTLMKGCRIRLRKVMDRITGLVGRRSFGGTPSSPAPVQHVMPLVRRQPHFGATFFNRLLHCRPLQCRPLHC
jgi:hypothetical protein